MTGSDEGEGASVKMRNQSYDTEMQKKQQKNVIEKMSDNWERGAKYTPAAES